MCKKPQTRVAGKPLSVDDALERIAGELRRRRTSRVEPEEREGEAAVSLILRPAGRALEFLAIKRALFDYDPWSGHMALPGGRREPGDADLWSTAVRETREEVGLDLSRDGRRLGRLSDVLPRSERLPSIAITPFVVAVPAHVEPGRSREVQRTLWVPAGVMLEDRYVGRLTLPEAGDREFRTLEYRGEVIWGLTLSILDELRDVLARIDYGSIAG